MGEYIDKTKLLTDINNGIKAGNLEEGYEQYQNINNMDDIIEAIEWADRADVVEREDYDFIVKNRDYYKDKYEHFLQLYDTYRHKNITLENKVNNAIEIMENFKEAVAGTKDVYAQSCVDYCIFVLKNNIGE